ncbi:MAG: hypothetical protein IKW30_13465 [Lachnospiraceae bacterium]|nr:hypothetical protein [Lachnospiraceae bacterium]
MKKKKIKYIPFILMLVPGSITSIMTYIFQYEIKTALLVLLSVLLVFYCMGLLLVNVIISFDRKNEEERIAKEKDLAKVVEKENAENENQPDTEY